MNGDGVPDNGLSRVVTGLLAIDADLQQLLDDLVRRGEMLQLVALQASGLADSSCVGLSLYRGKPGMPPVLDGSDFFTVDQTLPSAHLRGTLHGGALRTLLPQDQSDTDLARIDLWFSGTFGLEIPIHLYGAHVSGDVDGRGVRRMQIVGVLRADEVQRDIVGAMAKIFTLTVRRTPEAAGALQVIKIFETPAKCAAMPNLCCKTSPQTCEITADELRDNDLIKAITGPDLQMFDEAGHWAPAQSGDRLDSLSAGICYTLVPARF